MKTNKKQSSPKTGNQGAKTIKQARIDAVEKEVNKPAVDKMARKLDKVNTPKARALTDDELKFLTAGKYRADYIREHLALGWDSSKKEPRELDAGKGWESLIRLGAENKAMGDTQYLSYKTQCQQAMEELTIPYSLQGAGAKQLVNIKPVRVSKGGSKGKDNTKPADKDKPSQNAVSTWLSNIQAGLKEHEIEELAFELADSLAPVSQLALLKHLAKNNEYAVEVEQFKKAS